MGNGNVLFMDQYFPSEKRGASIGEGQGAIFYREPGILSNSTSKSGRRL